MVIKSANKNNPILLAALLIGMLWIRSSYGKFSSNSFSENFAQTISRFASKNPYPWYKNFLENVVIKNAELFANLVLLGELLTALSITAGSILILIGKKDKRVIILLASGFTGGMFLNAIFWLASGWTSPSSDSLNLLMFGIETIGLISAIKLLKS